MRRCLGQFTNLLGRIRLLAENPIFSEDLSVHAHTDVYTELCVCIQSRPARGASCHLTLPAQPAGTVALGKESFLTTTTHADLCHAHPRDQLQL